MTMSSPRVEALAYRIWAYAEPMGWNVTSRDIADETGIPWQHVVSIVARRNWTTRLRTQHYGSKYFPHSSDCSDADDQFGSTALSV